MTTGKTTALTRQTFVDKVVSLLFNMLSRLVITVLPRSKRLLISWLQSPSTVILEPVEVRNRFKGLDLIDRVPDELWNEVRDIVQETGIKTHGKEMQKSKMAVWGGLTNSCEKKRSEKQRIKGKI